MAWDDSVGHWFTLGRTKLPCLDTWKSLSSVKGAHRVGAITTVDEALDAAEQGGLGADYLGKQLLAYELFLACDAMLRGLGTFDLQARQRRDAVEQLRTRAKAARDYYSSASAVVQTVLTSPFDVFALVSNHASPLLVGSCLLRNYLFYARGHWHYVGTSTHSGEDLLAGRTTSIPCGGIANALRILLGMVMPGAPPAAFTTLSGRLVTKGKYRCFDPLVKGNIRNAAGELEGPCLFNNHYFLFWPHTGLYYDPCMATTYVTQNDVIAETPTEDVPGMTTLKAAFKPSPTKADSLYVFDESTTAPGFGSTWARVAIKDVTEAAKVKDLVPLSLRDNLQPTSPDAKAIADFCARVK